MKTPLIEKNIFFCDSMLKAQLYDMIKISHSTGNISSMGF
jgi:hypothetical protein